MRLPQKSPLGASEDSARSGAPGGKGVVAMTTSTARQTAYRPEPNRLPFYFDPVPDIVRLDIARGKLTEAGRPGDGTMPAPAWRVRCAPGSACTKEKIAAAPRDDEDGTLLDPGGLGKHPRTIQRSFARLKLCGHLKHVPDLSDRTGYRLEFPSLQPIRLAAGTETSLPGRPARPGGGDSRVSPPQPHSTYARPETQTQDTTDEFAREAEPQSSPSFSLRCSERIQTPEKTAAQGLDVALVAALVARVVALFGLAAHQAELKIRAAAELFPLAWIAPALDIAERFRSKAEKWHWGVVLGILKNFRKEGGPAPPGTSGAIVKRLTPAHEVIRDFAALGWDIQPDGSFKLRGGFSEGRKAPPELKARYETHKAEVLALIREA